MTEATPRAPARRRASRAAIRFWTWVTGGLAFLAPFAALAGAPQVGNEATADQQVTRELVIRQITRRVVIQDPPAGAPVRYVYVPSSAAVSSGQSSAGTVATAPAPAPPPTTTTGGS
jgi:hypothetical protein